MRIMVNDNWIKLELFSTILQQIIKNPLISNDTAGGGGLYRQNREPVIKGHCNII